MSLLKITLTSPSKVDKDHYQLLAGFGTDPVASVCNVRIWMKSLIGYLVPGIGSEE